METNDNFPKAICCSLKWAKKLNEAGWKYETLYGWVHYSQPRKKIRWKDNAYELTLSAGDEAGVPLVEFYAPTAEEILRRLPPSMLHRNRRDMFRLQIRLTPRQHWQIGYATSKADWVFKEGIAAMEEADTLANAAAAMWCYLKEQNLLPPKNEAHNS